MKTICIIGLGTISRNHRFGLVNNPNFKLIGVCDVSGDAVGKNDYAEYPFFNDYQRMIAEMKPDFVVVTVPPAIHARVAIDAMERGCSVIVEKPTSLSEDEMRTMAYVAKKDGRYFETVFHWQYGYEVLFAVDALKKYGKIKKITVSIEDPYSKDGVSIDKDKMNLCGTFLDSGTNAISLLYKLVDFGSFSLAKADYTWAANADLPVHSFHRFERFQGTVAEIEVDWRRGVNRKYTLIVFEDGGVMKIDHSGQGVYYNDELIYSNQRFEDRLTAHYYNYYNLFEPSPERYEELFAIGTRVARIWEGRKYWKDMKWREGRGL